MIQPAFLSQFLAVAPLATVALLVVAYLLGSIPTAVWISKLGYGQDIRTQGSGNAGSTNTYRVLGFWPGFVVQVVDILKGTLAALLPWFFSAVFYRIQEINPIAEPAADLKAMQFLCGLLAVVGHIWPVLAGFRGGKGMNTLLGMMVAVFPWAALIAVGVFVAVLLATHMVSAASMAATWTLPAYLLWWYQQGHYQDATLLIAGVVVPLLVMYTHRSNIARIRAGNESKVGFLNRRKA